MPFLVLAALAVSCSDSSGGGSPQPDEPSDTAQLGREIGEAYLLLIDDTVALLELNLPADQLRPALRTLKEDYRVRFANLGCLREAMSQLDRAEVERRADDYVEINGGQDSAWLTQGTQRYASDAEIPTLLSEIQNLRAYAFFNQIARTHPGEHILCG